jgi:hypothetical protein
MKSEDEDISVPRLICAMVEWMSDDDDDDDDGFLLARNLNRSYAQYFKVTAFRRHSATL